MKKIVFLVILLCVFGFISAQNVNQTPPPWTTYCNAIAIDSNAVSSCISCLAWWWMYYPAPWWVGPDCWPMQSVCSDSYSDADKQAECMDSYNECINWSWSPDRCACRAIGGISLNTTVPFVGNCISLRRSSNENTTQVTPDTAFPLLIVAVTKIMMTVILIFCFLAIIVGGVMMSMGWADEWQYNKGKDLIKHVVIALALLGASWVILRIINPSFFT